MALPRVACILVCLLFAACVNTGDQMPRMLQDGPWVYPAAARAAGIEGYVEIAFRVLEDGRVSDARVVAANPANVFDDAALRMVSERRYRPAMRDGRPVAVTRQDRLNFKLDTDAYSQY